MYKILIVDDEQDIVESIKSFLEKQGFVVSAAFDGEEAKAAILKMNPHLVLLDLIMPKTNGFEVLKWTRENVEKRIGVIILSIKDKLEDIKKGYNFDADLYLPKPFTNQELLRGINTVLSLVRFRKE
ncbi:MAG: response regulator [Candidatus Omnitrophica bacterium]|nr:response regulator [Candidatus Omnitrophota bacterium]